MVVRIEYTCDFCHERKAYADNRELCKNAFVVAGDVCICDACIGVCNELIIEHRLKQTQGEKS